MNEVMTLPELARLWFSNPLQHAIIVRNIIKKSQQLNAAQ